jgi:hypothetical protein
MSTGFRLSFAFLAIASMALLCTYGGDAAAVQTKDQQKCTNAMNKAGQKAAAGAAKDIQTCVKAFAKGGADLDACVAGVGEKYDKAVSKTVSDYGKKCPDALDKGGEPIRPSFGVSDPDTINAAALAKEQAIIGDIFGSDLLSATVLTEATDKDGSKCQQTILKDVYKCQDTVMKEFNGCKKAGLKSGNIQGVDDLADCICESPKNKITKACVDKISGDISKKCDGKGVDLSDAFPGCNTDDAGELQICLEDIVSSRVCEAIKAMDDLSATSCPSCPRAIGTLTCTYDLDQFCSGGSNDGSSCEFASDCPGGKCIRVSTADLYGRTCAPPYSQGPVDCSNHGLYSRPQEGEVRFEFGVPNPVTGVGEVKCRGNWSAPVIIPGVGVACPYYGEYGSPYCTGGKFDCDGGTPLDFIGETDHLVGAPCGLFDDPNDPDPANHTGPAECEATCLAHCADKGMEIYNSGCEGYCRGGALAGSYCSYDVDCLYKSGDVTDWDNSGECVGADPVAHANYCNCMCTKWGGAPSRPGAISCHMPVQTTVEYDEPCDKMDVSLYTIQCVSRTTETNDNIILDSDGIPGAFVRAPTLVGLPKSCSDYASGNATGLLMRVGNWTLDGSIGDLNIPTTIQCQ